MTAELVGKVFGGHRLPVGNRPAVFLDRGRIDRLGQCLKHGEKARADPAKGGGICALRAGGDWPCQGIGHAPLTLRDSIVLCPSGVSSKMVEARSSRAGSPMSALQDLWRALQRLGLRGPPIRDSDQRKDGGIEGLHGNPE